MTLSFINTDTLLLKLGLFERGSAGRWFIVATESINVKNVNREKKKKVNGSTFLYKCNKSLSLLFLGE